MRWMLERKRFGQCDHRRSNEIRGLERLASCPSAATGMNVKITASLAIAFSALAAATPCRAEPNVLAGKAFALANCSHCHSIDKVTRSTLAIAPPFRTLHKRYPVESLEEALAEGIMTGHPSMPEFKLDPGQIGDLILFLKSLEL
jgi:cytochrome c